MHTSKFKRGGEHSPDTGEGRVVFVGSLVHEKTHGILVNNLGSDRENANVDWITSETGNGITCTVDIYGKEHFKIEASSDQPALLYRTYSYTVYKEAQKSSLIPGNANTLRMTEVITTGMEALVTDPEAFLRGFPKHANLILDNLRGLR